MATSTSAAASSSNPPDEVQGITGAAQSSSVANAQPPGQQLSPFVHVVITLD
jgi:hypothetical protein